MFICYRHVLSFASFCIELLNRSDQRFSLVSVLSNLFGRASVPSGLSLMLFVTSVMTWQLSGLNRRPFDHKLVELLTATVGRSVTSRSILVLFCFIWWRFCLPRGSVACRSLPPTHARPPSYRVSLKNLRTVWDGLTRLRFFDASIFLYVFTVDTNPCLFRFGETRRLL